MSLLIRGRWTAQPGTPGVVIFEARTGSSVPAPCHLARPGPRADALVTTGTTLTLGVTDFPLREPHGAVPTCDDLAQLGVWKRGSSMPMSCSHSDPGDSSIPCADFTWVTNSPAVSGAQPAGQ